MMLFNIIVCSKRVLKIELCNGVLINYLNKRYKIIIHFKFYQILRMAGHIWLFLHRLHSRCRQTFPSCRWLSPQNSSLVPVAPEVQHLKVACLMNADGV